MSRTYSTSTLHDRAHLDRAAHAGDGRDALRELERPLLALRLDEVVAAERLLRLCERAVGDEGLAVADPHGHGLLDALQLRTVLRRGVARDRTVLVVDRAELVLRELRPRLRVVVDQQHVLHVVP